jgi:hypothetical protein
VGGEGTSLVAAFTPEPFAAALGVATLTGLQLLADALDLQHRLPRIWAAVEALTGDSACPRGRPVRRGVPRRSSAEATRGGTPQSNCDGSGDGASRRGEPSAADVVTDHLPISCHRARTTSTSWSLCSAASTSAEGEPTATPFP